MRTFTVSFPGACRLDELARARLIARQFGTEHTEIMAETASINFLPSLARHYDQPVIYSTMVSTFPVSWQTSRHCTVALGGDGGDELFGGYSHYGRLLKLHGSAALLPLRRVVCAAATHAAAWREGSELAQPLGVDFARQLPLVASYFDIRQRHRMLDDQAFARDIAGCRRLTATRDPRRFRHLPAGGHPGEGGSVEMLDAKAPSSTAARSRSCSQTRLAGATTENIVRALDIRTPAARILH